MCKGKVIKVLLIGIYVSDGDYMIAKLMGSRERKRIVMESQLLL